MNRGMILIMSVLIEVAIVAVVVTSVILLPLAIFFKALIVVGGIASMPVVAFLLVYFQWAPNNMFFTFVSEGRAKIVVRADEVTKILIQWKNHVVAMSQSGDTDVWDVIEGQTSNRRFGGLRWYGWWPLDDIFVYNFSWTNVTQNGEVRAHDRERLDHVLLKDDVYLAVLLKAEDKELLPLDIKLILTIKIVNPYKAVFVVQDWLETVINRITQEVRNIVTQDTYKGWIATNKDLADRIIVHDKIRSFLDKECKNRYGVEVRAIEVMEIDPGEEYRKDTLAEYLAQRGAERKIIEAKAEKERLKIVAEGEVLRIRKTYKEIEARGDLGKLIRTLEAIEKSPGEGSKWVIPLPGMTDLIGQVFPGKSLESFSAKDITKIREIIESFQQADAEKKS